MKWVLILISAIAALAIGLAIWVRAAPSDPGVWHVMPGAVTNRDMAGGAMRVVGAGEDGLIRLDSIIRKTPRTTVLAGSPDEGMITYITRSKLFGFPDYTTIRQNGAQIELYARLRFGASDLGVNAKRLDRWLALFGQRG